MGSPPRLRTGSLRSCESRGLCEGRPVMSQDFFVVIEHLRGRVADISYVMLAAARALTKGTGGQVVAVLLGENVQALAARLAADRALSIEHPALAEFPPAAHPQALPPPPKS